MKYILKQNNLLYITDGEATRVIPLQTWEAKDTTNKTVAKKVLEHGEELVSPDWNRIDRS